MKYDILESFKGSPDGRFTIQYTKGEKEVELTDSLAEVALAEKLVKPSKITEKPSRDESAAPAKVETKLEP
jgi:hypothetical protein